MAFLDAFRNASAAKVIAMAAEIEALRSELRSIKLEWIEAHDKLAHLMDRARKRDKALAAENRPENGDDSQENLWELARKRGLLH